MNFIRLTYTTVREKVRNNFLPLQTVFTLAAVAACSVAQLPLYPGLYGAYPGLHSFYRSGMPLMHQPTMKAMTPASMAYNMAPFASMAPIYSQYGAQNEFGQYSFGYNAGFNARAEMRDAFGNVRGSYNYLDADGKVQTQHYVADALGYRVSGTNLPEAPAPAVPEYTPEVAAARAAHQAAHSEATAGTRQKRSLMVAPNATPFLRFPYGFSSHMNFPHPAMMGSALPYSAGFPAYAAAPGFTPYAGLPALTYASAAPAAPLDAEVLRVENNPNHAVSYRVY
ncbi:uncharacterized protein [Panulirus ornatus]|uniref:uncharacterized protein n=1 Tax=Panulirus ornatus TaxID=150431 RepID=UPI003A8ADD04